MYAYLQRHCRSEHDVDLQAASDAIAVLCAPERHTSQTVWSPAKYTSKADTDLTARLETASGWVSRCSASLSPAHNSQARDQIQALRDGIRPGRGASQPADSLEQRLAPFDEDIDREDRAADRVESRPAKLAAEEGCKCGPSARMNTSRDTRRTEDQGRNVLMAHAVSAQWRYNSYARAGSRRRHHSPRLWERSMVSTARLLRDGIDAPCATARTPELLLVR